MHLADLPQGFVIAHRGGALQAPEDTLEAYRLAVGQGVAVIEQDVQVLADGALGVMHDGTVDRTTTASGNVADRTAATWRRLTVDAGAQLGGGWGDDLHPPLFEDVLAEFAGRALLCPEAKSPGTMAPMVAALERHGADPASVLVQSFSLADCELALARGWPALWLGATDAARAAARGIGWVGVRARDLTQALCAGAHAHGVRVACYTVDRRAERDAVRAAGADAIFSDDPAYLHSDDGDRTSDLFATGTWQPGVQADAPGRGRGRFLPDGSWGLAPAAGDGAPAWVLVGYLRPSDPAAFTVHLRASAGASVLLTTTDRPATGAPPPGVDGYEVVLPASGGVAVHEVTGGVRTRSARGVLAPSPDGSLDLRVTVTATGVAAGGGGAPPSVVLDGAAHRPLPFVRLGHDGAGARFRAVVLS